jgi:predicted permease
MISRLFIDVVSLIVPAVMRERWREEWRAELAASPRHFDSRIWGAVSDAVAMRRASRHGTSPPRDLGTSPRTPGLRDLGTAGLRDDLRLSLRLARRHPGHSALTIVVVALGVGLTTAVLSIGYAVFLKPWPIHEPERVAFVFRNNAFGLGGGRLSEHTPGYDVVAQNPAISSIASFSSFFPEMTIEDVTKRLSGELVTAAYFGVIGVDPILGRTFHPDEDTAANTELTIVISHRLWQRSLGGRPDVLGRQIRVMAKTATIIGVLAPDFHGLSSAYEHRDWWMLASAFNRFSGFGVSVIRLAPGYTVAQAAMGLAAYGQHANELERESGFGSPSPEGKPVFEVIAANQMRLPMNPAEILMPKRLMWALFAVVGMVMAIAVASITGLGIARGLDREAEVATRRVLGVSTWRLGRQLVVEQSLLTVAGGMLASVVAWNLITLAMRTVPDRYLISAELDWRLFVIALGVSLVVGVFISLAPLGHALRIDLAQALSGASATTARAGSRSGLLSLTPQVAFAAVLLVAAGVHVKSLLALETADLGYTIDGRTVMELNTSGGRMSDRGLTNEERHAMLVRLNTAAQTWSGVSGGLIGALPVMPSQAGRFLSSSEVGVQRGSPEAFAYGRQHMSPGVLNALNIKLLAGRDVTQRDYELQAPVAVVSEAFARRMWPGEQALGQRFTSQLIYMNTEISQIDWRAAPKWVEVIGVASDVTPLAAVPKEAPPVYVVTDSPWQLNLVLAGTSDPAVIGRIRDDVQAVDPTLRVTATRPMSEIADEMLRPRRTAAAILTATGLAGLALACIGLYAHVALSVARRRREFGIRSALGASASNLVMHIVRDHGRIALLGALLGLGGAIATLRLSSRVVRDVPTADLTTFVVVPVILIGVCLLACVLPARRAGTVDPVSTLKA